MSEPYPHQSADDLLITHLKEQGISGQKILILNDAYGGLSGGLGEAELTTYTDSYISAQAILKSTTGRVTPVHQLDQLQGSFDRVVMKLPHNISFFEDELAHLSQILAPQTPLICTGMVKYMPKSYFDLLHTYFGETTTSLAQKKARLIFTRLDRGPKKSPYPLKVKIENFDAPFVHHSNLFSREKLDIGTRFFLEHLPQGDFKTILDLGCANGIVGIRAKQLNPHARVLFSDDSSMAVESARANVTNQLGTTESEFIWTNCFENQPARSLDLVLCNPPFHQAQLVGDSVAWQMLTDSRSALRSGGTIRVIGNNHLDYGLKLKKIFGNSIRIAVNSKFSIFEAVKA